MDTRRHVDITEIHKNKQNNVEQYLYPMCHRWLKQGYFFQTTNNLEKEQKQ